MTDLDVVVNAAALDDLGATYATIVPAIQTVAQKSLEPGYRRRIVRLKPYPGRPRYPLRWKSARQRRAFFATNGFGRGIPYQRSNRLQSSWYVERQNTARGADISIGNRAPHARYVIGHDQQPFHADTGWQQADAPMEQIALEMAQVFFLALEVVFDANVRTVR